MKKNRSSKRLLSLILSVVMIMTFSMNVCGGEINALQPQDTASSAVTEVLNTDPQEADTTADQIDNGSALSDDAPAAENDQDTDNIQKEEGNTESSIMVTEDEAQKLTASSSAEVASIGSVKYATLQAAVDAASGKDVINVLEDLSENVVFNNTSGSSITLNMNGHTLSTDTGSLISINTAMSLTITGNGTFIDTNGNGYCILMKSDVPGIQLTVENGTFSSEYYCISERYYDTEWHYYGGSADTHNKVTIKSGNFDAYIAVYLCNYTDLVVENATMITEDTGICQRRNRLHSIRQCHHCNNRSRTGLCFGKRISEYQHRVRHRS